MTSRNKSRLLIAAGLLAWSAAPEAASAQRQGAGGRTVYEADYFRAFSPANAMEIVARVPGFTLDPGVQDVRGFGQAAGNVVIDGARPSSKADTLDTILARIPASRVARIEVGPGDLFGADFAGKTQVLNLVLTAGGGLAGTLQAALQRDFSGRVAPQGSVSVLARRGRSSFNLSAGYTDSHTPERGPDTLTSLPDGALIESRAKYNDIDDRSGYLAGSWELAGGAHRGAHLNFRLARDRFVLGQANRVVPALGPVRDDRLTEDYRRRDLEVGGDVSVPLLGGGLKAVGLATRRHRLNRDASFNRVQDLVIGGFAQDLQDDRGETLLRLVWSRSPLAGWSVEAGAEGVLNRLDSRVDLFGLSAGGARSRIDLPIGHAIVTERRGEAFVNAGRPLSRRLRLDLGLTYELSRLTVIGDARAQRTLGFPKPKAVLDWKPKGRWHGQLSVARTVAQLAFEDFISGAELTNDRVNGGNADLVPQRAWEALAELDHPILGDGLVKVELGADRISLLQDRVPTAQGFDAPGNLGSGRQAFGRFTFDAPLARVGVKGGRLTVNGMIQSLSVEDPYTQLRRPFSGVSPWSFDASFRQDRGRIAWGLTYFGNPHVTFYRLDEVDRSDGLEPYLTAFVEYRPDRRTTVTLGANNLADVPGVRDRTFFFPSRSNPTPSEIEHRLRNQHVSFFAQLKKSFG